MPNADRLINNANTPSGVAVLAAADFPDATVVDAGTAPLELQLPYLQAPLPGETPRVYVVDISDCAAGREVTIRGSLNSRARFRVPLQQPASLPSGVTSTPDADPNAGGGAKLVVSQPQVLRFSRLALGWTLV